MHKLLKINNIHKNSQILLASVNNLGYSGKLKV